MQRSLFALAAFLLIFPVLEAIPSGAEDAKQAEVVVHLGHFTDDLHSASMAMSLAGLLQRNGARVAVFLDREGVRLADSRVPQDLSWGRGAKKISKLYEDFVKGGGSLVLCPHCAEAAGLEAGNLRAGARIGTDAEVAKLFLGAERVIDY